MENSVQQPVPLTRYAWLSIAAALVTITMKSAAYLLTGSVGLLSDASNQPLIWRRRSLP